MYKHGRADAPRCSSLPRPMHRYYLIRDQVIRNSISCSHCSSYSRTTNLYSQAVPPPAASPPAPPDAPSRAAGHDALKHREARAPLPLCPPMYPPPASAPSGTGKLFFYSPNAGVVEACLFALSGPRSTILQLPIAQNALLGAWCTLSRPAHPQVPATCHVCQSAGPTHRFPSRSLPTLHQSPSPVSTTQRGS